MRIGDCIAEASWRPYPFFSFLIKCFTGPVTHVSMYLGDGIVVEAVKEGLKLTPLVKKLKMAKGHVWWLPLSKIVKRKAVIDYYNKRMGAEYDLKQAIRSGTRKQNELDDTKLFCSEAYLFGLLRGGAIQSCNCSEATPTDVVRMKLYTGCHILKGRRQLRELNTIEPEGFGF